MKAENKQRTGEDLRRVRDSFIELIDEMELEEDIVMTAGLGKNGIVAFLSRELEEQEVQELGLPAEIDGTSIEYTYVGGVGISH